MKEWVLDYAGVIAIVIIALAIILVFVVVPPMLVDNITVGPRVTTQAAPEGATILEAETVTMTVTDKAPTGHDSTGYHIFYVADDGTAGRKLVSAEEYARIAIGDELQETKTTYVIEGEHISYGAAFLLVLFGFVVVLGCLAVAGIAIGLPLLVIGLAAFIIFKIAYLIYYGVRKFKDWIEYRKYVTYQ